MTRLSSLIDLNYELKVTDGKIGHALIIVNQNFPEEKRQRKGAEKDTENLGTMFDLLNIKHFSKTDLTSEQMEDEIEIFATKAAKTNPSIIFIAISSHGHSDYIFGIKPLPKKGEYYDTIAVTRIQELLNKYPKLTGVPKVLILQACRGDKDQERDKPATAITPKDDKGPADFAVISKDTLIVYPTSLSYTASRNSVTGSWMITELCKCVKMYKNVLHLTEILTICTYATIIGHKDTQTCTFKSSLTKFLSFKDPK